VSSVDVLLVPVGGRTAINAVEAAEVVRQLEPRFVVPMHYAIPGLKLELDGVERFLKEMAVTAPALIAIVAWGTGAWRARRRRTAITVAAHGLAALLVDGPLGWLPEELRDAAVKRSLDATVAGICTGRPAST